MCIIYINTEKKIKFFYICFYGKQRISCVAKLSICKFKHNKIKVA